MVAGDILQEAEQTWKNCRMNHRDSCIRIGVLTHNFIIARLKEADGKSCADRLKLRLTREASIQIVARTLKIRQELVSEMIRISKVIELLGDPGELSYRTLRVFTVCVRRVDCAIARGLTIKVGEVPPSESEIWEIKPTDSCPDPIKVYRQAIAEKWDSESTRKIISGRVKDHSRRRTTESGLPSLAQVARHSNPKDLAEMIVEMIRSCPRPEELKRLIIARIS